jgi:hypothetical protein
MEIVPKRNVVPRRAALPRSCMTAHAAPPYVTVRTPRRARDPRSERRTPLCHTELPRAPHTALTAGPPAVPPCAHAPAEVTVVPRPESRRSLRHEASESRLFKAAEPPSRVPTPSHLHELRRAAMDVAWASSCSRSSLWPLGLSKTSTRPHRS